MSQRHPLTRTARRTRPLGRPGVLAATAVLGVVLSGCGVTDTQFRPGVALDVNGRTISEQRVDDVTTSLCAVLTSTTQLDGQDIANVQLRNAALRGLALQEMGEQMLAYYGAELPADQDFGEDQAALSYGTADPEDLETAMPTFTGDQYLYAVLVAIGQDEVGEDGEETAALEAGVKRAQEWQEQADIRTSPAFESLEIGADRIVTARDDLSVAASDFAKQAIAPPEEGAGTQEWVADLPESQRCTDRPDGGG